MSLDAELVVLLVTHVERCRQEIRGDKGVHNVEGQVRERRERSLKENVSTLLTSISVGIRTFDFMVGGHVGVGKNIELICTATRQYRHSDKPRRLRDCSYGRT